MTVLAGSSRRGDLIRRVANSRLMPLVKSPLTVFSTLGHSLDLDTASVSKNYLNAGLSHNAGRRRCGDLTGAEPGVYRSRCISTSLPCSRTIPQTNP